jgi:hypothetical protein
MQIEAPELNNLISSMPSTGNVINNTGGNGANDGDLTEAEKLAKAEAALKARNEGGTGGTGDEPTEPTEEEVQAKLDELSKVGEDKLSDEDKEFINKYTQQELDEITATRQELEGLYGVKLEGTYENSPEGLKQLTKDITPILVQKQFMESLQEVPYMKEFYEHVTSGKSIDTFIAGNTKPAFEGIELKEVDEFATEDEKAKATNNQKKLIELAYKDKDLAEDDIKNFIDLYEANGKLFEKAKAAQDALKKSHKAKIDSQIQAEEQRIAEEQKQVAELVKQAESIIEKNDFDGFSIPATDVKVFKDAILKPVDQKGNTAIDYKRAKLTLSQRLLLDYIVMKDFKNIGLGSKTQARSFNFKKAADENNKRGGGRLAGAGSSPSIDLKQVNFENLMKQK